METLRAYTQRWVHLEQHKHPGVYIDATFYGSSLLIWSPLIHVIVRNDIVVAPITQQMAVPNLNYGALCHLCAQ